MIKTLFAIISLITISTKVISDESTTLDEYHLINEICNLHWKVTGTHEVPNSYSTFTVPENRIAVIDDDAKKFAKICYNEMGLTNNPSLDNLVIFTSDYDLDEIVCFENYNVGYIPLKEWKSLDSQKLMEEIQKYTEKGNLEHGEILQEKIVGWVHKPSINEDEYTIQWAFEIEEEFGESFVEMVVIKLGRFGYTKITHSIEKHLYDPMTEEIDLMLQSYDFIKGARYQDFSDGDKISTIDLSSLATHL